MSKKRNKGGESGPSGRSGSAHRGGNDVGAGAQSRRQFEENIAANTTTESEGAITLRQVSGLQLVADGSPGCCLSCDCLARHVRDEAKNLCATFTTFTRPFVSRA